MIKQTDTNQIEIIAFKNSTEWREWLKVNHSRQEGILLRLFKKHTGIQTITHKDALDEALCFGWIDAQGKSYDSQSWLLKFTPRRAKSIWSKHNIENTTRLINENRMTEFGLQAIELAKADGRWAAAYDSPKTMSVPEDFLQLLKTDNKAEIFFKTLNKANIYAIAWRLQTAKNPGIRKKRIHTLFTMMQEGKKLH
jgi:uncharacterized protein YdeI (YjbR/CyaY-like superfamily)